MTRSQQLPMWAAFAILAAAWVIMSYHVRNWGATSPFCEFFAIEMIVLGYTPGATLTPYEMIAWHGPRRRRIAWDDVEYIEIQKRFGSRVIAIYQRNGRRTQLRAPVTGFLNWDKQFEEKFHAIGQWWLEHRTVDPSAAAAPQGWSRDTWTGTGAWGHRSRIRPAFAQVFPVLLVLGYLIMTTVVIAFGVADNDGHGTAPTGLSAVLAVLVLVAILTAAWHVSLHAGVSFTDEALKVHSLRPCTIAWTEITSIAVERTWHGTRLVVHEASGRDVRLSAPRVGILLWDGDFEAKARAVHARWQAALGGRSVAALDLSAVRKPAVWRKALLALVCIGLGGELLVGALVTALTLA
ncbi:hypothetical protein KDL01_20500 [Actinospica durhamensis]|uniref:PH domain-containing protein n=1 Tax=Actinospica durhamensis TaxID=1508375 RepID=A0A941ESH5_9ACTN|nr:hypothetical protein [Actinospica durhamensis]MBR7835668.1 hypothetical protein [Actinospica durhamensis]